MGEAEASIGNRRQGNGSSNLGGAASNKRFGRKLACKRGAQHVAHTSRGTQLRGCSEAEVEFSPAGNGTNFGRLHSVIVRSRADCGTRVDACPVLLSCGGENV